MLEQIYLTRSKVRGKMLGFLFSNAGKEFYLSELARQVSTSPGNIQREIAPFLQDGLIRRTKRGGLVFYSLNPSHALFSEIQSLILKTLGVEGRLRALVEKMKEIKFALLYGSFAQEKEHGESDIDLLVVSEGALRDFYSPLSRLESELGREINATVYSSGEFRKRIQEKNGFISHVLSQPHRVLKGDLRDYQKTASRGPRKKN